MQGWEERYLAFWAKREEGKKEREKGPRGRHVPNMWKQIKKKREKLGFAKKGEERWAHRLVLARPTRGHYRKKGCGKGIGLRRKKKEIGLVPHWGGSGQKNLSPFYRLMESDIRVRTLDIRVRVRVWFRCPNYFFKQGPSMSFLSVVRFVRTRNFASPYIAQLQELEG